MPFIFEPPSYSPVPSGHEPGAEPSPSVSPGQRAYSGRLAVGAGIGILSALTIGGLIAGSKEGPAHDTTPGAAPVQPLEPRSVLDKVRSSSASPGSVWAERPFPLADGLGEAGLVRFIFDPSIAAGEPIIEPAGYELRVRVNRPDYYDPSREAYFTALGYLDSGKPIELFQKARSGGEVIYALPKEDCIALGLQYLRVEQERPLREAAYQESLEKGLYVPPVGVPGEPYPWKFQSSHYELNPSTGAVEVVQGELLSHTDSRFQDKIVIIDVWATWCGGCMSIVRPELTELYERNHDRIEIISVDFAEVKPEFAMRAASSHPSRWHEVVVPEGSEHEKLWGRSRMGSSAYSISDVIIVGPDGEFVRDIRGAERGRITEVVNELLARQDFVRSETAREGLSAAAAATETNHGK